MRRDIARPIPHADAARETALLVEDRRIEDVFRQPDQRQLEYPPRIRALHLKAALGIRIAEDDAATIERRRKRREGLGELHRAEEHTSELQSLMRISYAVFC